MNNINYPLAAHVIPSEFIVIKLYEGVYITVPKPKNESEKE